MARNWKIGTFVLAVAMLALLAIKAYAAGTTANVSWTAPTTYTDGETLAASDLAYYTIAWSPLSTGGAPAGMLKVIAPAITATVPVPCGGENFTVSVTTSATAKYPNATSAPSGAVPYASGVACTPNPPTGLTVQ